MSNIQIIHYAEFAQKRWRPPAGYAHAAKAYLVPIVLSELANILLTMPIAFIEHEDALWPAAVLGLKPERNFFVAPDGAWRGDYVPAALRAFPFHLVRDDKNGQFFLAIDVDSGLVSEGPEGKPFFTTEGKPEKRLQETLQFLTLLEQDRQRTLNACAVLARYRLTCPWTLKIETSQGVRQLAGLQRLDEAALQKLSGEALHDLQQAGALALAYGQLFSMQHLPHLARLAAAEDRPAAQPDNAASAKAGSADPLARLSRDGNLDLSGLF